MKSYVFYIFFTLILMMLGALSAIWLTPIPHLPTPIAPAQLAVMRGIKGAWFSHAYTEEARLNVPQIEWRAHGVITAIDPSLKLFDPARSHIFAKKLTITSDAQWRFDEAELYRRAPGCLWHLKSASVDYSLTSKEIKTEQWVSLVAGKNRLRMQGIHIPLNTQQVTFGGQLQGSLDPHSACSWILP